MLLPCSHQDDHAVLPLRERLLLDVRVELVVPPVVRVQAPATACPLAAAMPCCRDAPPGMGVGCGWRRQLAKCPFSHRPRSAHHGAVADAPCTAAPHGEDGHNKLKLWARATVALRPVHAHTPQSQPHGVNGSSGHRMHAWSFVNLEGREAAPRSALPQLCWAHAPHHHHPRTASGSSCRSGP